jgi:hypothetical protein
MKYRIKIGGLMIGVLIAVVSFVIYLAYHSGPNPDYEWKTERIAPQEYWDFFSANTREKMSVIQTITLKFQSPIADFTFDNKKYFIEVFKLEALVNQPLDEFITTSKNSKFIINGVPYLQSGGQLFNLNFKTGRNPVQHVNVDLYGADSTVQIRNDSIVYFHSNFKLFSVNYNHSDTTAIWATTEGRPPQIPTFALPIEILFIKKHGVVYLLIMSVNDSKTNLPVKTLYNLYIESNPRRTIG